MPIGMPKTHVMQHSFNRFVRLVALCVGIVLVSFPASVACGGETVGMIDTFGLAKVDREAVLEAVGLKVGDPLPRSTKEIVGRLEALAGVKRATVAVVLVAVPNAQGSTTGVVYVGIDDGTQPRPPYRVAPTSDVVLPVEIVEAYREHTTAWFAAFQRGDLTDDVERGNFLMRDKAGGAAQEKFLQVQEKLVRFSVQSRDRLLEVLETAGNAEQRAMAASIVRYTSDKRAVTDALVAASRDPDATVRNNAMRALGEILDYALGHPELEIEVRTSLFVDMLNSLDWTDRNKALFILNELTATGKPGVLEKLRESALPNLAEMARWKYDGHALMAMTILGRLAGLTEEETVGAWKRGERENVISRALKSKSAAK
jgi:hypothetical protein